MGKSQSDRLARRTGATTPSEMQQIMESVVMMRRGTNGRGKKEREEEVVVEVGGEEKGKDGIIVTLF